MNSKTLDSLQTILNQAGYTIRYEKGNFNTGFCLLENTKTMVINKFSTLDAKINALATLIQNTEINQEVISDDKLKKVLLNLQQTKLQL
ncbi:MAG: hypothetical protein EAZ15_06285 [Sphingobacteriales bacterium]|nr:MAG: hypothetical protein EAZ15_06285 [Sphingobacteriales bacterium]